MLHSDRLSPIIHTHHSSNTKRLLWCDTHMPRWHSSHIPTIAPYTEGFGQLTNLKDLNLGFCKKLDMDATFALILKKFQGLTKLDLAGWEMTALPEGEYTAHVIFGLTVSPHIPKASGNCATSRALTCGTATMVSNPTTQFMN